MITMSPTQVALIVISLTSFDILRVESRSHNGNNNKNSFHHRMSTLSSKLISSMGIEKVPDYKNVSSDSSLNIAQMAILQSCPYCLLSQVFQPFGLITIPRVPRVA